MKRRSYPVLLRVFKRIKVEIRSYQHLEAGIRKNYERGGIRTPDPQDRNLMLYPLSYAP